MKKTLIASAIAAATVSSTAFAMDPATQLAERLDSMPTFYGNMQLVYINRDADDELIAAIEADPDDEYVANDFADNGSTFGVKHEHEIAPGMTGFFKAEFEFDAGAGKGGGNGIVDIDEAYLGVKGSFGSVQFGSDDTVYEWANHLDFTETVSFRGDVAGMEESDNLQYYSPEIAGGLTVGVTLPIANGGANEEKTHSAAVAGTYATDMFEVTLAYAMGASQGDDAELGDSIGLAATVNLGDLSIIGQFETKDADSDAAGDDVDGSEVDLFGLAAIYSLGSNQFAIGYIMAETDTDDEATNLFLQALHNFSDNMYAYVEYTMETIEPDAGDEVDDNTLYVGATYAF